MVFSRVSSSVFKLLALIVLALSPLAAPGQSFADEAGVDGVWRAERMRFGKQCKTMHFAPDYLTLIDYNNDKRMDVVTNPGAVTCDGVVNPECSMLGCMTRFYTQLKDGSYHLTAEMQLYDWRMRLRYGNMVFVMTMQGGMCNRTAIEVCTVEYRVRELRFVELKRE
ncbi:hypothetical protein [Rhizobium sp. L1K21]|uniref:hypothetical protein n=1 Tax=Rhizobium sp. L1K21 TaxID=2954933 RepID=UPI0020927FC6|nr:hypothetical protein [Rhizobium sp. L1K21]MCO6184795.1 hypothetical protein [Rhizobium sp. L1K21]